MALTPNERLALLTEAERKRVYDLMWAAQDDLFQQIDKATSSGADITAMRLRQIHRDISVSLQSVNGSVSEWAAQSVRSVYTAAMDVANMNLEKAIGASILPKLGFDAPLHVEAMTLLADAAYTPFNDYLGKIGRRVDDVFRNAQLQQARSAIVGGQTQAQMARNLRSGFEGMGIFDFTDKSGRTWDLKRYTEMVSRTVLREAETQGSVNRMAQAGVSLGKVSSHGSPCDVCGPWEGRILDLTGESKGKYPTMDEARAGGLWHPNCKHNLMPHVESIEDTIKRLEDSLGEGALPEEGQKPGPTQPKAKPPAQQKSRLQDDLAQIDKLGSPKAAQKWAQERFPQTDVDFKGMDLLGSKATCRAIAGFDDLFPGMIDHGLDYIGTYRDRGIGGAAERVMAAFRQKRMFGGEYAHVRSFAYGNPIQSLGTASKWFGSSDDFLASLARGVDPMVRTKLGVGRFHPAGCDTIESVVWHELGHFLDNWMGKQPSGPATIGVWKTGSLEGTLAKTLGRTSREFAEARRDLSLYATTNTSERWAEAFAQATCGIDPEDMSDLGREVHGLLDRLKKEYTAMAGNPSHKPVTGIGMSRGSQ